ncbi:MAG: TIGR01777 family oxidoreductase [Hyphomicrobium sp.]
MPDTPMTSPLLWTLVSFQLAMGCFDVIFHHELTERLAWRSNAGKELKLHAARNAFYALLFVVFAWIEPHGAFAWLLLAILASEIFITLADFVEEDMSRKLPATERVLHTLLAINYGGILVLIGPAIMAWTALPSGYAAISYGWGSWILTGSAVGCALFAVRDFYTSARANRFVAPRTPDLSGFLNSRHSVLITGGTGFIGTALVRALAHGNHDVTVLTRSLERAGHLSAPVHLVTSLDQIAATQRFDAIVDLAGEAVAGGLWTRWRKFEVIASRRRSLRSIEALVHRLEHKPRALIKASAIGVYGLRDDTLLDETAITGDKRLFSVRSCLNCEAAAATASNNLGVRTVWLRIGLVLGRDGGLLGRLLPVFDLALGGRLGSGQQWMSWIALEDMVRLIAFTIGTNTLEGAVNATAPNPVRNRDFVAALGAALNRPAILPVPGLPLELVLGDFAREIILGGQRVVPSKARAAGFSFLHADLDAALKAETCGLPDASQLHGTKCGLAQGGSQAPC